VFLDHVLVSDGLFQLVSDVYIGERRYSGNNMLSDHSPGEAQYSGGNRMNYISFVKETSSSFYVVRVRFADGPPATVAFRPITTADSAVDLPQIVAKVQ